LDKSSNPIHAPVGCSIVIRAYNEEKNIGRLLMGINQQTIKKDVEVILVDSGSTHDTVVVAKTPHWFPEQTNLHQAHPFCNNANAAVRRSLWDIHPYDESLTGLEDLEWEKWAMEAGYSIAYVSEAEITHIHEDIPAGVYNRYRREAMAFKRLFPNEHFTLWDFWQFMIKNITSDLRQAALGKCISANLGSIIWFRAMQFWGTYQGFHRSSLLTWQLRQTFYYPHGIRSGRQSTERDADPVQYKDLA